MQNIATWFECLEVYKCFKSLSVNREYQEAYY